MPVIFKAFPHWHETIEDLVAEGDKVWVRLKIDTGIHTGELNFLGVSASPTGKKSTVKSIQSWRIGDGGVVEQESVYDELDFLRQPGLIQPTEKAMILCPDN